MFIMEPTKIETVQQREVLNAVWAIDDKGVGGANHSYQIDLQGYGFPTYIHFQNGARKEKRSLHGVLDQDLLEIVKHRLTGFQSGNFSSEHTAEALEHVQLALEALNRRIEERIERDVLGKHEK